MSAGKALKTIALTAVAQDHHNAIKIKNVLRWLKTGHEVRVQINGKSDRQKAMEGIFRQIETDARGGAQIIQKVVKPDSIKFYLKPTKDAVNIMIDGREEDKPSDVDQLTEGKDIFSDEFELELEKSINEDKSRSKRK